MQVLQIFTIMTYVDNPAAADMFNFFFSIVMWFGSFAIILGLFVRWLTRT